MIDRDDSRVKTVLGAMDEHRRWLFPFLTAFIVAMLIGVLLLDVTGSPPKPLLPREFRLIEGRLSNLPVEFSDIRSCSCWHGPRDEAQRKYKFRIVNHSDRVVDIGGGVKSAIRLIVAYPKDRRPTITMPAAGPIFAEVQLGSPADELTPITERIINVKPSLIRESNELFGAPEDYRIWALPPSPNKVAEFFSPTGTALGPGPASIEAGNPTYPTVVDQTEVLPGEEYAGHKLGHGTWSFYIPIPHRFASRFRDFSHFEFEPILPRQDYERHVIFIGVAAMEVSDNGEVHLLGFAPAPSENALVSPRTL
ncbi:MAG TPA: hypothetical protein VFX35_02140 [Solirubrobacterales bacterium]|nr:hypothetical protein [Solirubrobacterales bacterium]